MQNGPQDAPRCSEYARQAAARQTRDGTITLPSAPQMRVAL